LRPWPGVMDYILLLNKLYGCGMSWLSDRLMKSVAPLVAATGTIFGAAPAVSAQAPQRPNPITVENRGPSTISHYVGFNNLDQLNNAARIFYATGRGAGTDSADRQIESNKSRYEQAINRMPRFIALGQDFNGDYVLAYSQEKVPYIKRNDLTLSQVVIVNDQKEVDKKLTDWLSDLNVIIFFLEKLDGNKPGADPKAQDRLVLIRNLDGSGYAISNGRVSVDNAKSLSQFEALKALTSMRDLLGGAEKVTRLKNRLDGGNNGIGGGVGPAPTRDVPGNAIPGNGNGANNNGGAAIVDVENLDQFLRAPKNEQQQIFDRAAEVIFSVADGYRDFIAAFKDAKFTVKDASGQISTVVVLDIIKEDQKFAMAPTRATQQWANADKNARAMATQDALTAFWLTEGQGGLVDFLAGVDKLGGLSPQQQKALAQFQSLRPLFTNGGAEFNLGMNVVRNVREGDGLGLQNTAAIEDYFNQYKIPNRFDGNNGFPTTVTNNPFVQLRGRGR
jgi:hypothetical protein